MEKHELLVRVEVYNPAPQGTRDDRAIRLTFPAAVLRQMAVEGYGQVFMVDREVLEAVGLRQVIVAVERDARAELDRPGMVKTTSAHGEPKLMGRVIAHADGAWWAAAEGRHLMRRLEYVEQVDPKGGGCTALQLRRLIEAAFDAGSGRAPRVDPLGEMIERACEAEEAFTLDELEAERLGIERSEK